jgi:hypothetical protein
MINNNLNLSICRVKVNSQIRKFKITKLKQGYNNSNQESLDYLEGHEKETKF